MRSLKRRHRKINLYLPMYTDISISPVLQQKSKLSSALSQLTIAVEYIIPKLSDLLITTNLLVRIHKWVYKTLADCFFFLGCPWIS